MPPSSATAVAPAPAPTRVSGGSGAKRPISDERKGLAEQIALYAVVILPFLALIAAIPLAWGKWLSWTDVVIALVFYVVSGMGITVGYHRHFTHGSFKAKMPLRVFLGIAGSLAVQGPIIQWVADHRRHHAYSDRDGDPHSPWRYGTSVGALTKGLLHAHVGWLFEREQTNKERFAPDLIGNKTLKRTSDLFGLWVIVSLGLPALIGGLVTWSWGGALSALFWAGFVRIGVLHHVTWSINSICHAVGERPFSSRDMSSNFWPLAILSFGESWHNLHHADPTAARHGVMRGQIDISARTIWIFEKLGWASSVKWPSKERIAAKLVAEG
ncbi:stearoyl-CoA desaturase (delta-9 desaturase) [Antricoccus suffuscus]|uniref:Stearoyl-CoA desaturase (Delta-9 desaturase) n=1 Tax=Antricoccus suffuscus TaxID=1629062 RepID=A0A2T1A0B2_9ACTN|nr:acyl-CoA desaturase [Antricoccus suffuscus]PRZ41927.1 stearoyl-CoA desaturase (delta-9 desaturase) [Antricoccus suffuscus]